MPKVIQVKENKEHMNLVSQIKYFINYTTLYRGLLRQRIYKIDFKNTFEIEDNLEKYKHLVKEGDKIGIEKIKQEQLWMFKIKYILLL